MKERQNMRTVRSGGGMANEWMRSDSRRVRKQMGRHGGLTRWTARIRSRGQSIDEAENAG